MRRAKQPSQVSTAPDHQRTGLESEVMKELRDARSQAWKTLARELEKATPPQPDFGEFGRFRKPDR